MVRFDQRARRALRRALGLDMGASVLPSAGFLEELMQLYRVDRLVNVDESAFRTRVDEFLALEDAEMEGLTDPAGQRDLTMRFRWGHDHDFVTQLRAGMELAVDIGPYAASLLGVKLGDVDDLHESCGQNALLTASRGRTDLL